MDPKEINVEEQTKIAAEESEANKEVVTWKKDKENTVKQDTPKDQTKKKEKKKSTTTNGAVERVVVPGTTIPPVEKIDNAKVKVVVKKSITKEDKSPNWKRNIKKVR